MSTLDFYQAPASKAMFFGTGIATVLSSFIWKAPWTGYDIMSFPRFHKLLASQFVFGSVGEMILGLGLIYKFRLFERRMGSSKFVVYTMMSTILSLSLQMIILLIFPGFENQTLNRMAPGPFSYIFSLFVQYFAYIPKLNKHSFLGLEFSEKSFVYVWGCQFLFTRGKESLLTGLCGFLGGIICVSDKLPFRKFEFPQPVKSFGKSYLAPLFASRSPTEIMLERSRRLAAPHGRQVNAAAGNNANNNNNGGGTAGYQFDQLIPGPGGFFGNQMQGQMMGQMRHDQQQQRRPAVEEPSEEAISNLTALGFERDQVIQALRQHNNNVDRAANSLLS